MRTDFIKGFGEGLLKYINKITPAPDITVWIPVKSPHQEGRVAAEQLAGRVVPKVLKSKRAFSQNTSSRSTTLSGTAIQVIETAISIVGLSKAWVIHKIIDKAIQKNSPLYLLKDEIKKVTDSTAALLIAITILALTILFPIAGTLGIFIASTILALSVLTITKASFELHNKRINAGETNEIELEDMGKSVPI